MTSAEGSAQPDSTSIYLGKKLGKGVVNTLSGAARAAYIGTGGLISGAGKLFNSDSMQGVGDRLFQESDMINDYWNQFNQDELPTNDKVQSRGQRIAGNTVEMLPTLAAMVANPLVGAGLLESQAMNSTADDITNGVDESTAMKLLGARTAGNAAMLAMPAAFGTGYLAKGLTGAGIAPAQSIATDLANKSILDSNGYSEMAAQIDPYDIERLIPQTITGAGFGAAMSHANPHDRLVRRYKKTEAETMSIGERLQQELGRFEDARGSAESIREYYTDFEQFKTVLEANGITSPQDPRAPQAVAALKSRQARLEISQGDEATAAEDDAQAAANQAKWEAEQRQQAENAGRVIIAGENAGDAFEGSLANLVARAEAEARMNGETTPNMQETMARTMRSNGLSPEKVGEAFTIADLRQQRADADLATRNEIAPDYQGGNAAATGGQFDSGIRTVTLVDGVHMAEVVDDGFGRPLTDGNKVVIDVVTPSGEKIRTAVDVSRLTQHNIPANQRMSQDFMQRSSQPRRGVGEETMAGEKMPRRSTDRISGDEIGGRTSPLSDPYAPEARSPSGDVTVEQQPKAPLGLKAPRSTDTITDPTYPRSNSTDLATVDGQGVRSPVDTVLADGAVSDNLLANPDRGDIKLDDPNKVRPTGRMTVDSEGTARSESMTVGDRQNLDRQRTIIGDYSRNDLGQQNPKRSDTEQAQQPTEQVQQPHHVDDRLNDDTMRSVLKSYADNAGWAQEGGRLLRDADGNANGRTTWEARDPYWKEMPAGYRERNGEWFRSAVEKALSGKKLTKREENAVKWALDHYESEVKYNSEPSMYDAPRQHLDDELFDDGFGKELTDAEVERLFASPDEGGFGKEGVNRGGVEKGSDSQDRGHDASAGKNDAEAGKGSQQARAAEKRPANRTERGTVGEQGDGELLQSHDAGELKAKDQRVTDAEELLRQERETADAKRAADAERNDFKLAGSDRKADSNPDQADLLGSERQQTVDEGGAEQHPYIKDVMGRLDALDDSASGKRELKAIIKELEERGVLNFMDAENHIKGIKEDGSFFDSVDSVKYDIETAIEEGVEPMSEHEAAASRLEEMELDDEPKSAIMKQIEKYERKGLLPKGTADGLRYMVKDRDMEAQDLVNEAADAIRDAEKNAGSAASEQPKQASTLEGKVLGRVGKVPKQALDVTVKDGVLHVGDEPAYDFDSGDPITVKGNESWDDIKKLLKNSSAVSNGDKFFGAKNDFGPSDIVEMNAGIPVPMKKIAEAIRNIFGKFSDEQSRTMWEGTVDMAKKLSSKDFPMREKITRMGSWLIHGQASGAYKIAKMNNSQAGIDFVAKFFDLNSFGKEGSHGAVFEERVMSRSNINNHEVDKLTNGFNHMEFDRLRTLLENRGRIKKSGGDRVHQSAAKLSELLDLEIKYLKDKGVDVGELKDYFPRLYDNDAILNKQPEFLRRLKVALRIDNPSMTPAEIDAHANAHLMAIKMKQDGIPEIPMLDLEAHAGGGSYLKSRVISKKAFDQSGLREFTEKDVGHTLKTYFRKSAIKGELAEIVGGVVKDKAGNVIERYPLWNKFMKDLEAEGNSRLGGYYHQFLSDMIGKKSYISDGNRTAIAFLKSMAVTQLLKRAVISSLTEPLQAYNRTAPLQGQMAGVKNAAKTLGGGLFDFADDMTTLKYGDNEYHAVDIFGKKYRLNRAEKYKLAEAMGLIVDNASTAALNSMKFGLDPDMRPDTAGIRFANNISSRAITLTGLHRYTNANTVDMGLIMGRAHLDILADNIQQGASSKKAGITKMELQRLGISEAEAGAFAKYVKLNKHPEQIIADVRAGNKDAAKYLDVLHKFSRQNRMEPTRGSMPAAGNGSDFGSLMYGLTRWAHEYWYNVQRHNIKQFKSSMTGEYNGNKLSASERLNIGFSPVAYTAATTAINYYMITALKDLWAGRDSDEEWKKKMEEEEFLGVPTGVWRGMSQGANFGVYDKFVNILVGGARHGGDFGGAILGPIADGIMNLFRTGSSVGSSKNRDDNNTQERAFARQFYSTVVDAVLSVGATVAPVGGLLGRGLTYATQRDELKRGFVDAVAGESYTQAARSIKTAAENGDDSDIAALEYDRKAVEKNVRALRRQLDELEDSDDEGRKEIISQIEQEQQSLIDLYKQYGGKM